MARVLAVDVGSSSVRAQVFGSAAEEVGPLGQESTAGEHDPDRLVELTRMAVDAAGGGSDVDGVGVSCFSHSLVSLDGSGRPLTPVLGWRDRRPAAAAERLGERLDGAAIHARTGCHLHPSYWPAKLAWLAEEEPETFRTAGRFVSFSDYLYTRLLGCEPVTSLSLASGTGLLDLHAGTWDEELLETLGLDPERLPEPSDEAIDGWLPAWLDGACSNVGAGCTTRRRAALMIGTSGAFRTVYEPARVEPRPGLFLYRVDGRRVVEGGALSDGGNLRRWLVRILRGAASPVADRDPDSHGLTFLTLLGGERSPGWSSSATGAIHGLTFETTAGDLRQAALEGVAYRFAEIAALMPEVDTIVATGGALLHDEDWLQIMADVIGRPIAVSGVEEASLRGAAVLALERLGEAPSEAPVGLTFEPRAERTEVYRAARERQRRLYEAVT